jgi:hypothetical protein
MALRMDERQRASCGMRMGGRLKLYRDWGFQWGRKGCAAVAGGVMDHHGQRAVLTNY